MNKLAEEKSPYLLQHAHNPVDWLPWGEAAFQSAREQNKPIFLSIGYSTCHWCHVMEHESFENPETARYMNEHFINIKVDREERPDVDKLYMTFVQATTGAGGWPLSIFLTPELKPFFGGTYFPPQNAYGRISFPELLQRIATAWRDDRAKVIESSESVLAALDRYAGLASHNGSQGADWEQIASHCMEHFQNVYDLQHGGFGDAPKFPRPVTHDFLHRYYKQRHDEIALQMSRQTLIAMGNGGMNDHLGGGFHRYAVDSQWIVSHFEKMLYDQAQLVVSYLEMFQLTGNEYFATIARNTLDYTLRDLRHEGGGFFAGEDADSLPDANATHKEEGAFYVWTQAEIEEILGSEAAAVFNRYYGIEAKGNAPGEGDPHGEFKGKNIFFLPRQPDEEVEDLLQECREKLFAVRENRPRPHRDEKIIVAWNGLMISALARAAQVLEEPRYLSAAQQAARFIQAELWDESTGTLLRHYKDGAANVAGFAEDYAFLVRGLLDLFEAGFEIEFLEWAQTLNTQMLQRFWDEQGGGLFSSAPDENILLRFKEDYDGAEPSPNSIAAQNGIRLYNLLDDAELRERTEAIFTAFAGRLRDAAPAMPLLLAARFSFDSAPLHIFIVPSENDEETKQLLRAVHRNFLPDKILVVLDETARNYCATRLPFVAEMKVIDGKATAYVCRDLSCRAPVTSAEELLKELTEI